MLKLDWIQVRFLRCWRMKFSILFQILFISFKSSFSIHQIDFEFVIFLFVINLNVSPVVATNDTRPTKMSNVVAAQAIEKNAHFDFNSFVLSLFAFIFLFFYALKQPIQIWIDDRFIEMYIQSCYCYQQIDLFIETIAQCFFVIIIL